MQYHMEYDFYYLQLRTNFILYICILTWFYFYWLFLTCVLNAKHICKAQQISRFCKHLFLVLRYHYSFSRIKLLLKQVKQATWHLFPAKWDCDPPPPSRTRTFSDEIRMKVGLSIPFPFSGKKETPKFLQKNMRYYWMTLSA